MSNEVIIDGVNVAECKELQKVVNEEPYCDSSNTIKLTCKGNNCYFKQLQRAKAENEKLKEQNKSIAKDYVDVFIDYQKYKQALEDIREILCYGRTFYDGYFDSDKLSRTDEAIKRVNEVLNESH